MVRPTGETVSAEATTSFMKNVNNETWTTMVTIVVPSEDHEQYYLQIMTSVGENGGSSAPNVAHDRNVRVYDVTDGVYYPINDSGNIQQLTAWASLQDLKGSKSYLAIIPRNVAGHTLRVQMRHNEGSTLYCALRVTSWGHSPHKHQ